MRLAVLGLCLALVGTAHAQTPVSEVLSAALVAPFDQSEGHRTYLTAHGGGAFSPLTGVPAVITHWTFWSETCEHLANFNVCLTQDDSVVIDLSDMGAIGPDNERLDSRFNLEGFRGLVTVHAYQTDARCRHPGDLGFQLIDRAIWGTWSIANTRTNAAAGDRMQSLNLGDDGAVAVPDERFRALDVAFFNPESLTSSEVVFLVVVERFGDYVGELGPPQGRVIVGTQVQACDVQEQCLSLPDLQISCALFSSLIPGPGAIIPGTLMPGSSGFLRLSSPRFVKEDPAITGGDLWLYAWHLQQLGPFGTGARGTYLDPIEFATPTPTPSATPTSSPTPGVTPTLATSTPGGSPTPSVTPSVGVTGTPELTATPALSPTPSPGGSPTPIASPTGSQAPPTGTPEVTATPTGSPTPVSTPSATPTGTSTPAPTATIFGPP
jgi:hypothetical protein